MFFESRQNSVSDLSNKERFWISLGSGSAAVGFICFPFSSFSKNLLGGWNELKIVIYIVGSTLLFFLVLFALLWRSRSAQSLRSQSAQSSRSRNAALFKAGVCSLVLMATSAFSFFQDKISKDAAKENGLDLVSYGAFAIMSLSLSRQNEFGFELGVFGFFLGCVMVTALKINYKFFLVAAAFCFLLIWIRSVSDSEPDSEPDLELGSSQLLLQEERADPRRTGRNANNHQTTLGRDVVDQSGGNSTSIQTPSGSVEETAGDELSRLNSEPASEPLLEEGTADQGRTGPNPNNHQTTLVRDVVDQSGGNSTSIQTPSGSVEETAGDALSRLNGQRHDIDGERSPLHVAAASNNEVFLRLRDNKEEFIRFVERSFAAEAKLRLERELLGLAEAERVPLRNVPRVRLRSAFPAGVQKYGSISPAKTRSTRTMGRKNVGNFRKAKKE